MSGGPEPLFWCVWNEGGGSPTVKHASYANARQEAQRLARAHPGSRFVVMAAAVAFVKRDVDEVRFTVAATPDWALDDAEIPF